MERLIKRRHVLQRTHYHHTIAFAFTEGEAYLLRQVEMAAAAGVVALAAGWGHRFDEHFITNDESCI